MKRTNWLVAIFWLLFAVAVRDCAGDFLRGNFIVLSECNAQRVGDQWVGGDRRLFECVAYRQEGKVVYHYVVASDRGFVRQ